MIKNTFIALLVVFSVNLHAVIETYQFSDAKGRIRYQTLVDELRCPKCQNQNLSGSNSPIAKDLRRELHRMIEAGQGDEAIKTFMVKRYGNFVLYRPPLDKNTLALWATPIILLFLALLFVVFLRKKQNKDDNSQPLNDSEKEKLAQLLKTYS